MFGIDVEDTKKGSNQTSTQENDKVWAEKYTWLRSKGMSITEERWVRVKTMKWTLPKTKHTEKKDFNN